MRDEVIDPEIAEKLEMISMNDLNPGVSHPLDRDRAVETFRDLHKKGELPTPRAIEAWALNNGWNNEEARNLRNLAQAISEGKRVRRTLI